MWVSRSSRVRDVSEETVDWLSELVVLNAVGHHSNILHLALILMTLVSGRSSKLCIHYVPHLLA